MDLSYQEGDLGIYFPVDGKLGVEFAKENHLLREKDEQGNNIGGFIDPVKRNIKAIRLRGEESNGLFLKLEALSKFTDISKLKEGDTISVLNGTLICEKYVPRTQNHNRSGHKNGVILLKHKDKIKYPYFERHIDTKQLAYNTHQFHPGDLCTITLKMHGTSGRTACAIQETIKRKNAMRKLFRRPSKRIRAWTPVSGSRKVTLNFERPMCDGYYKDGAFRKKWHDFIAPKLHKGEEIFYEIVGYVNEDTFIMPSGSNKKLNDKEFIKKYGDVTEFTYGCQPGQSDVYVYRMTKSDEDGYVVEYPDWYMRIRCEQMGLKCVPKLDGFIYTSQEDLEARVQKHVDGTDPIGKTHIREGVVVRIQNREKFTAFKSKSFEFLMVEGIIKEDANAPDMEEAEEIVDE